MDIHCFKVQKNKVIVKELAGYDGKRVCHYMFKPLFNFELLEPDLQKEAEWPLKTTIALNGMADLCQSTNLKVY